MAKWATKVLNNHDFLRRHRKKTSNTLRGDISSLTAMAE